MVAPDENDRSPPKSIPQVPSASERMDRQERVSEEAMAAARKNK